MANKRTYVYASDKTSFTSLQTGLAITIPIASPLDFVWLSGFYTCDVTAVMAGTDVTFGGFLFQKLQLSDQDSIVKKPTPIGALFGTGGVGPGPQTMPYIARVPFNATIEMLVDNLVSATVNLYLVFIGFQWPPGEPLPAPYTA